LFSYFAVDAADFEESQEDVIKIAGSGFVLRDAKTSDEEWLKHLKFLQSVKTPQSVNELLTVLDKQMISPDGGTKKPVVYALAKMGERAVPEILQYIDRADTPRQKKALAVKVLVEMKGKDYVHFVDSNWEKLSPGLRDALRRYAVR
jgi:hypothetical protein